MSKNKKALGVAALASASLLVFGATAASAAVTTTGGTVIIGTKAYSMDYLMTSDPAKIAALRTEIIAAGDKVYFNLGDQKGWKDIMATTASTGMTEDDLATKLGATSVTYVKGDGTTEVENLDVKSTALSVSSVSAITPTSVTVVLSQAPAADLTAKDFTVGGNTVTNATKGSYDTIYTLTLGSSLDGMKGTLNVNGATKDYDFTQLKVSSVKALNLRQLQVNFSNAVDVTGIIPNTDGTYTDSALLDKLYIWITNEATGDVQTNSLSKILGANSGDWTATVSADKKSVVIDAKDGSKLTDAVGTGLGLKLNENFELEARDVLDVNGKYSDVSASQQLLVDNDRPSVAISNTSNTVILNPTTMSLGLKFSEPVASLKPAGSKVKIYIDGNEVGSTNITDVDATNTVAANEAASIDLSSATGLKLSKGTHTVAVVGAVDLNGNLLSNNAQQFTFTVVDPTDPIAAVKPTVTNVVPVADNAFKIVFNTANVGLNSKTGTVLTVKNGAYQPTVGTYADIVLKDTDFDGTGIAAIGSKKIVSREVTNADGITKHTEWIVELPATATTVGADETPAATIAYKGANVISRTVDLAIFGTSVMGNETTPTVTFTKDTVAPVIDNNTDGTLAISKTAAKTIGVTFKDAPFTTDGNGTIALASPVQKITVKYVDANGVTYSEEITPVLSSDALSITLPISNLKMLTADGSDLIPGGKYTLVLPDGVVKDSTEFAGAYALLDGAHPFVGKTVDYTVPGTQQTTGLVPQTTKGLIFSGSEMNNSIGIYASAVKTTNKLVLKDNQVVVVFNGEVDAATATNKNNYLLGGKVLPNGSTIEFRQSEIDGNAVDGDESYALITLPDNTITLTGGEDFAVSGVANKAGNKMLPVTDVVQLSDNTQPVASKVEVRDSNKIVVTFPETIKLTTLDMTQLATNFVITANGKVVSLSNATVEDGNKLVITTADNFDNGGSLNVPVSVQLKLNGDGNMFVTDLVGNKAAATVVNK